MKKKIVLKSSALIVSMLTLAGCLSPVKPVNEASYMIDSLPDVSTHRNHAGTLLVMPPTAEPAYNTTEMAYTVVPHRVAYFAKNRWAETPGQMLQPLLIQTLRDTHYFHAIVTAPYIGQYQYVLTTNILELTQDYTHGPAAIQLTVQAQLSRGTNKVLGTKLFSIRKPLMQQTPYGGVIAANQAVEELLREIAVFCMR